MMQETTTKTATLPHDLILDNILSRLPDESLIRLGCVCKLWYNSIHHDTHFPSTRFARKHPIVMFHFFTTRFNRLYYFYLNEADALMISKENNKGVELRSLLSLPNKKHNIFHNLVGCFNDLICMFVVSAESGGPSIQIFNPSRRQVFNISPPPIVCPIKAFGFGFDSLTNEYKIVWINVKELEYHCFVYTWENRNSNNSNSWREITGVGPYLLSIEGLSAVSCDGALIWSAHWPYRVLSFNLHDEKFQVIQPPFGQINIYWETKHYMEYKGCLCFADVENYMVKLFILKDKTKQTWIKETFRVPNLCNDKTRIMCFFDQVFMSWFSVDHFQFYNLHSKVSNVVKIPSGYFTEKDHLVALRQITKNDYHIFNHVPNSLCLGNLRF